MVASICVIIGAFGVARGNETRIRVLSVSIRAAIFRKAVRMVSKVAARQRDFRGAAARRSSMSQ
jgi:hypothetical protein